MENLILEKQTNIIEWLRNRLAVLSIISLLVFISIQFVILATVGTTGPEISSVKSEREKIRLENEIVSSEIRKFQTKTEVLEIATRDMNMSPIGIQNLYVDEALTLGSIN